MVYLGENNGNICDTIFFFLSASVLTLFQNKNKCLFNMRKDFPTVIIFCLVDDLSE